MKIGIIGCGTIGSNIAKAMEKEPKVAQILLYDRKKDTASKVEAMLTKTKAVSDIKEIIDDADLVVETASHEAARKLLPMVLEAGKDIVIMSVGVLWDTEFKSSMERLACQKHCKIYLPSGAVCGIDGLKAASEGFLNSVDLISVKHPKAFMNTKYLEEREIDLDAIANPTVLYKGPASEAVKLFPRNINVAATIAIAGLGFERTTVTIIADPHAIENTHKIIASGDFGTLRVELQNKPSAKNPSTSYIAVLSAVSTVKKIVGSMWCGA